jgi:hypothetical protein
MQFSNTTDKNGLIQHCEQGLFGQFGAITGSTDKMIEFTNRLNRAYDKLSIVIMKSDGRWQFDDENYNDLPIGSTDLIDGQRDYTFDVEHIRVVKLTVKDSAGNILIANPIDIQDPEGRAMYQEAPTPVLGIPILYDKFASNIRLYPTPNYDAPLGLTVHFQRPPSYFTVSDITKTAGVPVIFHPYLYQHACASYAVDKLIGNKNDLFALEQEMGKAVSDWYSTRSKDEQLTLRAKQRSSK